MGGKVGTLPYPGIVSEGEAFEQAVAGTLMAPMPKA
jgi:hypothetical protein